MLHTTCLKGLALVLLLLFVSSGCSGGNDSFIGDQEFKVYSLKTGSNQELDNYYGKFIKVSGKLGNVDGQHASLNLSSGITLYIPHIDKQVKGIDWFSLIDQDVHVVGKLVYNSDIPLDGKVPGPFLTNVKQLTKKDNTKK